MNLLDQETVDDKAVLYLGNALNLTELHMTGCKGIGDEGLKALYINSRLKVLKAGGCIRLSDYAVRYISSMKDLELLELCGCIELNENAIK
mmetsp:Transcript_21636/g.10101  ORF Transcript_21636/g.10101 Transcript_21636/m.10101 type:complete len:91 (+) Transcript_21636:367-639(+)